MRTRLVLLPFRLSLGLMKEEASKRTWTRIKSVKTGRQQVIGTTYMKPGEVFDGNGLCTYS